MTTNRVPQQQRRPGFSWGWLFLLATLVFLLAIVVTLLVEYWVSLRPVVPVATVVPTQVSVASEPVIRISPTNGRLGTEIAVWDEGWREGDMVQLYLDDLGSEVQSPVYAQVDVDADGRFFATILFPGDVVWESLPNVAVLAESTTSDLKATAVFTLLADVPTATATVTPVPTATSTPIPTATATVTAVPPTPTCAYNMAFVADVTIPDDTIVQPGVGFLKTWRVRNSGNCPWPAGSSWAFVGGSQLGAPRTIPVAATNPGEITEVTVYLVAPQVPGTYRSYWALRLPAGNIVGDRCFARIVVPEPEPTPTPLPTPPPPPTVIYNWRGEYFANTDLSGTPGMVRDDAAINFDWDDGAPVSGFPSDNFSVRWTRSLYFDAGDYRFYAHSDDGVRLWVDNRLLLGEWHDADGSTYAVELPLTAGNHFIQVEFYEAYGMAQIQLWWQEVTAYSDWRGEYWANGSLSGSPAFMRNDELIDFNWGDEAPFAPMPTDEFSVRWTRRLMFEPGTYRFYARADDGVRVSVDETVVLDEWHASDGSLLYEVVVFLEGMRTISVDYFEGEGEARVEFWFEPVAERVR